MTPSDYSKQLAADIAKFMFNPLGFALYAYPWGTGELVGDGRDRPRDWQIDLFDVIRSHLINPLTRFTPLLIAAASGHGVGKSAFFGMLIGWGMATCADCRILVTANTETQLRTKTWPEVTKWHNLSLSKGWFEVHATSMESTEKNHDRSWRADAIPWNEKRPEAFAGMHNVGKRIIILFDEASSIPNSIWEVVEGALTDEGTEIIFITFGNPTQNTGRFKECFGKFRHRWITRQIDSRTVDGTNKEQLQKWVDDYGEDSDFVRIRVKGEFPRQSYSQFISTESINACIAFEAEGFEQEAKIMALDVARFGDDRNSLCYRQGRKVHPFRKWYGVDAMQTTAYAVEAFNGVRPDVLFVDEGGMGGPVVDRLKQLLPEGKVIGVNFGWRKPEYVRNLKTYYNKRAEMYGELRAAIHSEEMDLPDDVDLKADLESVQYGHSELQQIQIEKKEDMKARGCASPDDGDALALTFAFPVIKDATPKQPARRARKNGWAG